MLDTGATLSIVARRLLKTFKKTKTVAIKVGDGRTIHSLGGVDVTISLGDETVTQHCRVLDTDAFDIVIRTDFLRRNPQVKMLSLQRPYSLHCDLPREVYVGKGRGKKEGATTESPMDGQDQPKIYTIRDHTLKVLMHPDVLELHAVRVVHTPQGDERQLHLKVRVRCGQEELVVDVLVDTGAQVSLVRRGLFKEESLQPSRRPVRRKLANGEIMGGGTHVATISMEF